MTISRRAGSVCAAALALTLCAFAVRSLYAEREYAAALGYEAPAGLDRPGRLAAYEEALRRDPGEGTYAYRAGQVRLQRAAEAQGGTRREHLERAVELLEHAVEVRQFNGEVRSTLSQALHANGDLEDALREGDRAVALAPRNQPIAIRTARTYVDAWKRSRDPAALRRVFELTRDGVTPGDTHIRTVVGRLLAREEDVGLHDLLEALLATPDLMLEAALTLGSPRPVDARILTEQARDLGAGR